MEWFEHGGHGGEREPRRDWAGPAGILRKHGVDDHQHRRAETYLKAHGDDVKKIVAAWNEAVKFAADNPTDADAIMAKFTNQKPEEFTKEKAGVRFYGEKENREYFGTAQKPGSLYKVTQRAADLWYELKFIKTKPKATDLIDGSFL